MKKRIFVAMCMLACIIQSCILFGIDDSDDLDENDKKAASFLVLHSNDKGKIGDGSYLSLMKIDKGEAKYEQLQNIYTPSYMYGSADINSGRVALGLHTDFNTNGKSRRTVGAWFDIDGGDWEELPILSSGDEGRYSYFDVGSVKVSKSGHIFYLSSSNDSWYFDQYRASLVRYDPETQELKQAISPASFAVAQPEKGWDTETANHGNLFFPSDDGRYVYGYVSAFGVDGGSYHWDYEILYCYDFDTDSYTRLGNPGEASVRTIGITSDRQYLAYTSTVDGVNYRNLVNTSTNNVIQTTLAGGQAYNNTSRWNESGYCTVATNKSIGVYNLAEGVKYEIITPSMPSHVQYDNDGSQIYFMMDTRNGKYLCRTTNNTTEALVDTLCVLQADVYEFMVVK